MRTNEPASRFLGHFLTEETLPYVGESWLLGWSTLLLLGGWGGGNHTVLSHFETGACCRFLWRIMGLVAWQTL